MTTKECGKCGVEKYLEEFHHSKSSRDGRHSICRVCRCKINAPQVAAWKERNRERAREYAKAYHRKRKYYTARGSLMTPEMEEAREILPQEVSVGGKTYCSTHGRRVPCEPCGRSHIAAL